MQHSLTQYIDELQTSTAQKVTIESELNIAHNIQMSMLPKTFPERTDVDIYGMLTPAKAVGGDLFDFFICDDQLFFCIGDVSGKGVPAALVMATTLSQFRNVTTYEEDLEKIIQSINKATCANNETVIFVTFFVGVLDLQSGQLQYCNAGHNKPFFVSDSITELPAKPDLPLGIDDGVAYVVREHVVPTGSMLFLYTDGLTEAMNAQREQFGRKRLADNLKSSLNCKNQIDEMTQAVHEFVNNAPQSDDLTMLAIKV
jgi:sigma-B regulation protein RsbU (phosphoserine phosphatase)